MCDNDQRMDRCIFMHSIIPLWHVCVCVCLFILAEEEP